jgi:hypothetical protein
MATVLEEYTTEEHCSFMLFCGQKGLEHLLFTLGSVCHVKRFTTGSRNVSNVSLMTKRLKQRRGSDWDLDVMGFCALVKQWDECCQYW